MPVHRNDVFQMSRYFDELNGSKLHEFDIHKHFLEDFFNANSKNPKIPTNPTKSFLVAGSRDERSEAKEQKPGSASSAALGIPESVTGCWPRSLGPLKVSMQL